MATCTCATLSWRAMVIVIALPGTRCDCDSKRASIAVRM